MGEKIRLEEVTLMRSVLALLIVFMHSFTCYQGGWAQPKGYVDISMYKWIARTSFAFTLEAFVFISGYLVAFQKIKLGRTLVGGGWIFNKLKRLILPCIIFGIPYFILFLEYKNFGNFIYSLINGCGHLWFLPMLFWCFIGMWLLEKVNIGDGWKLAFLAILYLLWPISLPLQLSTCTNYMVYFYGGYLVYKHSEQIKKAITIKRIVLCWIVYSVVFIIFSLLKESLIIGNQSVRVYRILTYSLRNLCQLIYATMGTLTLFISAVYYTNKHKLKPFTIEFASCCMGIYLIHQFILRYLYYKTSFPVIVGPYLMPWLGFIITTPFSFLLTKLFMKTKYGQFLMG